MPFSRKLIQLLSTDLYRRIHRRYLLNIPNKAVYGSAHGSFIRQVAAFSDNISAYVLRIGTQPEAKSGYILLAVSLGKFDGSCRTSDENNEQARCKRIERTGVADAPLVQYAAQLCNNVMACPILRLIDEDDPVHQSTSPMADTSILSVSSGSASIVQPDAILWPPPPKRAQSALLSKTF